MKSFITSLAIVALGLGVSATRANAAPLTFDVCESKPSLDAGCLSIAQFEWIDDIFGPVLTVFNLTDGTALEGDLDDVTIALTGVDPQVTTSPLDFGTIAPGGQVDSLLFDLFGLTSAVLSFSFLGESFSVILSSADLTDDSGFLAATSFAGLNPAESNGVPEPALAALVALGLGLGLRRRTS